MNAPADVSAETARQRVNAEALQMLASLHHCSRESARLNLVGLSQRHHIRLGVLSAALVAVVRGTEDARDPATGAMVVACAIWRREIAAITVGPPVSIA